MDKSHTFGGRLAQQRKLKKLTQDQLGQGIGTKGKNATKAVVVGWEKDRHFPRVDQLVLICKKLDTSADYLMFGKVEESKLRPELQEIIRAFAGLEDHQVEFAMRAIRPALEMAPLKQPDQPKESPGDESSSSDRRVM